MQSENMSIRYITDNARTRFYTTVFAEAFMAAGSYVENYILNYAGRYSEGEWRYVSVSNGAFYMETPAPLYLRLPNYFEGEVSAKEAGIIISLSAFSHFCIVAFEESLSSLNNIMAARYHKLRDYVFTLDSDSQARIFRALD